MGGVATALGPLSKGLSFLPLPFAGQIALALAASFILGALAPKPDRPRASVAAVVRGRQDSVRQSVPPHRTVYGEVLVGGYITYLESYGTSLNETLSMLTTFASHQVKGFREHRFGDEVLALSGNAVQGLYLNLANIYPHFGAAAQTVDAVLDAASDSWGTNHRGRGRAYTHDELTYNEDVFGDFRLEGRKVVLQGADQVFDTRTSTSVFTRNPALLVRDVLTVKKGYAAAKIDAAAMNAAANVCEEMVAVVNVGEIFTADASADEVTLAAAIKNLRIGDGVQVSTTGTLPPGLAAVTTYYWSPVAGDVTGGLATTYANALAGTVIDITGAGTGEHSLTRMFEPRYTADGTFLDSDDLDDVVLGLLAAMAGSLVHTGGKWKISAGEAGTAEITLDLDGNALAGAVTADLKVPRRELFNAVKSIFVDPSQSWQAVTAPAITSATYEAQDNGARIFRTTDRLYTTSPSMSQRLDKIDLERHRRQVRLHFRAQPMALRLAINDIVGITYAKLGYVAKDFRVINLLIRPDMTVDLSVREEDAAVWTWSAEEQTPAAPPALSVTSTKPAAPTALTLTSGTAELLIAADGTVHSRIKATWILAADQFVIRHDVEFKKSASANWSPGPPARGSTNEVFIAPVEDGVQYDVRVRAVNGIGRESDWLQASQHTVVGKSAPPADVTSFQIEGTTFAWQHPLTESDLDGFVIRYHFGNNVSFGDANPLHTGVLKSSPYTANFLPSGTITFLIKAVDTSGNFSDLPAVLVTEVGDPLVANVVETFDFHALGFPGTKTDGTVDGNGDLVADSVTPMWDANSARDMWTLDVANFYTGQFAKMVYQDSFTPSEAAAGSAMTIVLTAVGDSLFLEYRQQAPGRMWASNDSELMWSAIATDLMWSALAAFEPWPGSIVAVNDLYDIRATTGFGAIEGKITALAVTIDVPDLVERQADVAIASGGARLSLVETFQVIQNVQLTVQDDGGSAVTARIVDKSVQFGPLIKALDDTGADTTATVDAVVQGY